MVGHGFDYNDNFRDMLHVCVINKHGIDKFKVAKKDQDKKKAEQDKMDEDSSSSGSGSGAE